MSRPMLELMLPLPPSINHCYRNARVRYIKHGRVCWRRERILTRGARLWMNTVLRAAFRAVLEADWPKTPKGTRTWVDMKFFWPDRRRRDTHNHFKLLFDALERADVFEDDQWALPGAVDFDFDRENPRLEIRIRTAGPDHTQDHVGRTQ